MTPDPVTLDEELRDALRADGAGQLRERVLDLGAAAWRMSCRPDAEAAVFRRLAEALRDAILRDDALRDTEVNDSAVNDSELREEPPGKPSHGDVTLATGASPATVPSPHPASLAAGRGARDRSGSSPRAATAGSLATRLAEASDQVRDLSAGRLAITAADPAERWRQLHIGALWLPETQRKQAASLLGGQEDYLVPPLAEAGEPGVSWQAATSHPGALKALDGWPAELDDLRTALRPVIGVTLTVVDLAEGLYTASGTAISAVRTEQDRQSAKDQIANFLATLASPDLDPYLRVDWLSELDAALRSVFPLPLPSPYSMWAKRYCGCLDLVRASAHAVSAGAEVELVKAGTSYEDPARYRHAPSDNVPLRPFHPAELNTVLWPLRAYVRVPGAPGSGDLLRYGRVIHGHGHGASYPALPA